jgi:hypothetical protein
MEHADALEILAAGAVEPGGLERLMAGDTPEAAALAGHLAGCDACAQELADLQRDINVIRGAVRTVPPAELRARTLAFVAAVGRDRSTAVPPSPPAALPPAQPVGRWQPARVSAGLAAVAGVVVLSVAISAFLVGGRQDAALQERDAVLAEQREVVSALVSLTTSTLQVEGEADARRVKLSGSAGSGGTGSVVFSPSSGRIVVVVEGIGPPGQGSGLQCWFDQDGRRSQIGRLLFAGTLAYWVGDSPALAAVRPGTTFGISVVDAAGGGLDNAPIMEGRL